MGGRGVESSRERVNSMEVRVVRAEEWACLRALVWETFQQFVAPDYIESGVQAFRAFLEDDAAFEEMTCYAAFDAEDMRGVLVADERHCHIVLFFVRAAHQGQGIGRALWEHLLACQTCSAYTVNASPFAVTVYRRLGFRETDVEQVKDGIRFTPMRWQRE